MMRATISFFALAMTTMVFNADKIAGPAMDAGKLLTGVFLVLGIISLILSVGAESKSEQFPWPRTVPSC